MKAPDKIYTDGRNISQMPVFDKQECTEYIRKGALLEWAKEKHDNTDNMDVRISMAMIMDKLNSL